MNDAEALDEAKRLARGGQIRFSWHALRRMERRSAERYDVIVAILTSTVATYQADRRNWKLRGGHDRDGDSMTVVVDFVADLLVVTIF